MNYFLGIDAGATKTLCVLADETSVLARSQAGTIKTTRVDNASAQKNLQDALSALSRDSGVSLQSITRTCVGLSGISVASVAEWTRTALTALVSGPVDLCGDEVIALDAAFHGGRGALVIAGTGSHVVARTQNGEMARTGGWGPVVSDQGAGSRIGLLAVRQIFHAIDADEETSLLPAVHAAWKTRTIEDLVDIGNRPQTDLSRLAPLVVKCAEEGDDSARRVLLQSGEELAELVLLALRKADALEALASSGKSVEIAHWTVAHTGSAVEKIALLRESMMAAVRRVRPATEFLPQAADAALGAVWRARVSHTM